MTPLPLPSPAAACAPAGTPIPLAQLAVGQAAIVVEVRAGAPEVERLAALGLVPGAAVRVLRRGDSLAVAVGQTRIGLGRSWAQALSVVRV